MRDRELNLEVTRSGPGQGALFPLKKTTVDEKGVVSAYLEFVASAGNTGYGTVVEFGGG